MGFLGLFGKGKKDLNDKLSFNLKPLIDSVNLTEVFIGNLYLPTGKIIAGDPFFISNTKPFKLTVNPGTYPVKLLIHKIEETHFRIAFSKIVFSDVPATKWILALTEDTTKKQIESLQEGDFLGYGVDAGLGCFRDSETNSIFNTAMDNYYKSNPDKNYYDDVLAEEFKTASGSHPLSRDLGDWNNHSPMKGDNRNVIMFSSGWGDGSYPTYWGTDSTGKITELVTEFFVIKD